MITVIQEKEAWDRFIASFEQVDFYHTYDYHQASKNKGERPVLLKYSEGVKDVAIPLLIRDIANTSYYDATSVYGYPGPLSKNIDATYDNSVFINALNAYFNKERIISVFSRLNPFIPHQNIVLKGMGSISSPGNVVYIDLQQPADQQHAGYNRRLKTYINKCRRAYTVVDSHNRNDILQFIEMYYENMHRVNAKQNYFFDRDYFFDLLASDDFKAEILLAVHNESREIIGGAMFLKNKRIVQYHLSGVKERYLKLNPIKLLIDEMRERATREGYAYLNLGGGVGNKEDSLYQFKSGFSKDNKPFELWKYIVDDYAYHKLVQDSLAINDNGSLTECGEFFPIYRCHQLK